MLNANCLLAKPRLAAAILISGLTLAACGGSGGGGAIGNAGPGNAELVAVHHGRLVDVFGLRNIGGVLTFSLYQTDVLVGPDIRDERQTGENQPDTDVLYDFISANPDTLQPRLFIPRDIESDDFRFAFDALDDATRLVIPAGVGHDADASFSVVPRNAGIRLTFAEKLDIDSEFFVERDEEGRITGVRNTEAVQLLKIVGDPSDGNDNGDFEVIPTRVTFARDFEGRIAAPNQIIIDPVLLGGEGLDYQTRNNAAGMPEAPDQIGANIRVAVALDGPLAIPGIREDSVGDLTGRNNSGNMAVIRDLRAGNRLDDSSDISRGFIRDPIPPRIVGNIPFFLERVEDLDEFRQEVTLFKNNISHEIDRGDVLRLIEPRSNTGIPAAVTEVVVDPPGDRGDPGAQHVVVQVRRLPPVENGQGQLIDPIENLDPSDDPGYPQDPAELNEWLVQNAARAILVTEFTASRVDPNTGIEVRDDPRNFITFSPSPLPNADGTPSEPNQNVSPFAGAIFRFTKPVDLTTVKTTDTYFFATRNLLDPEEIEKFRLEGGRGPGTPEIDESTFREAKFRTPHLVASRLFDEDGSQTALRLQPMLGFFLNDDMRVDEGVEFEDKAYRYFLHVVGGDNGITDLSGNSIDFQADNVEDSEQIIIPFSLDTRQRNQVEPVFPNNIVASVVRAYNDPDEDEQPSYYRNLEVQPAGMDPTASAVSVPDIFGAVLYLRDGTLQARTTTRVRQVVDNLNQAPPPPQTTDFRWCPERLLTFNFAGPEGQVANNTAAIAFAAGIQNPLNPFGCRLQAVWREIDLGLSRVDPFDFNLDVEQMYWAPFTGSPINFDEFDRVSMFLGHSEYRPEPCVGGTSALPSMDKSGLNMEFANNYLHNNLPLSMEVDTAPAPHPAYVDATMGIDPSQAITEPNGINRFLPLPTFQKPYFVWRDETVMEQGGRTFRGTDGDPMNVNGDFTDYIPSPFLGGYGGRVSTIPGTNPPQLSFNQGKWSNARNWLLTSGLPDEGTGGLLGSIALPLLADFWTFCDSSNLPAGNGFIAAGTNGWQISLTVQSNFLPAFRSFSGGFAGFGAKPPECVDPSSPKWSRASGGFTPQGDVPMTVNQNTGGPAVPVTGDNSIYWIMADFLKRTTVVTAGFVPITNPHRVPTGVDPRLGPFDRPTNVVPVFNHAFQPPLETLPGGTSVVVEFRGSGDVDPDPWRSIWEGYPPPNGGNFPMDPLKAGDAHIRKFDDRAVGGQGARNWWTYFYNRTVTSYTDNLNTLMDPQFTTGFNGPFETFLPKDVKYFNWRFLMTNNVDANPPISPSVDTFVVTYRFEQVR